MTSYVGEQHSQYPYSAVCLVVSTFADGQSQVGTGTFVSANDVLTASHLLWQTDHLGAATSVTVYPGYDNGAAPYGAFNSAYIHYYQINDAGGLLSHSDAQYDVGIISLSVREGDVVGTFGMDPNQYSGWYNLTGYPDMFMTDGLDRMTNDWGYAEADPNYWTFNYVDIFSYPGNSGGPLWYQGADGPYVVGVASTTSWAADIYNTYDQLSAWIHSDGIW